MPTWRVLCEACGQTDDPVEATARISYATHAGHGIRSLHYCGDDLDAASRWNDRDDPRAHYEESV
ncbi:MAG: hypothetical protein NUW22_13830 [Acidobacteria bacterium]|nr:hypothetical protein [Acidobacteriota bacterium]